MIRHHIVKIILSFLWLVFTNSAVADICDISNGSGIGGTGAIAHISHNGIGGSGKPASKSQHKRTTTPLLFDNSIGGTGAIAKIGKGIGGTGAVARENSGIGGTGSPIQQAGVIIGTITGFGSICVNGIEIHYTSDTPLHRDDQLVTTDNSFAIGQVVAVSVFGTGNEVTATEMHILHTVTGPVSSIDIANNEMEILGQSVQLPTNSDRINANSGVQIGDYIEVSGLRNHQGNIIASRINEISPTSTVSIIGPISEISATNFKIQELTINAAAPQGASLGQEVQATGVLNGDGLTPNTLSLAKENELTANVGGLVSIEGYINKTTDSFKISGRAIDVPSSLQNDITKIAEHQRVIITGQLGENNVIILDHLLVDVPTIDNDDIHDLQEPEDEDTYDKDKDEQHESIEKEDEREEYKDHGYESSEYESPETPEYESPEAPEYEAPETPEYESPEAPEYEAPETPEYEAPEVPEYEAPEAPEYESPEAPEYEAPEVPEYEAPEVPEYEAPEVPEYEAPEVPEYEAPEVPEYEAPEVPEYEAPEVPEYEAPEVPEYEAHDD
ncbi:MAG: hypothetical protein COA63_007005 [Methylophaga sp.]|nr:hypothetical protein [Methylophaga sp.]